MYRRGWDESTGAYSTVQYRFTAREDKNNNTLLVARAKRVEMLGGRQAEQHHHRARSFIGLALVAVFGAWHVSVISRTPPPRAVSSSQTLVSSSHILPQHYHCHY
jgi:hypothetical protein